MVLFLLKPMSFDPKRARETGVTEWRCNIGI